MTEERTVKLSLRDKDGKLHDYFFDFVPQSKKMEYIRKEAELEARTDENGEPIQTTTAEYDEMQAEFVASLFSDKAVTKKAIIDGLDASDFPQIYDIIRYRVLGFSREEDAQAKKELMEQILHGQTITDSK